MESGHVAERRASWQLVATWLFHGPARSVLAALALSFGAVAAIVMALGADPIVVFRTVVVSSVGNTYALGQTVNIASLLVLTGLAAVIPFSARLWNVGGEGQLYVGAFAAFAVSQLLAGLPAGVLPIAMLFGGFIAGSFWGFVPGALRTTVNANEVITSLMMSFIAILAAAVAYKQIWPSGFSARTVPIPEHATLPSIVPAADIDIGAPLALVAVIATWIVLARTRTGFQIRAAGLNPEASRANGINVRRLPIVTFVMGGGLAGLAGAIAVAGIDQALIQNFSQNYGFLGIAVALLSRLNPLWVVPSATLFAALSVGGNGLAVQTGLSADVGQILGACFVILLVAFGVIRLHQPEIHGT